jgi:hypothetical protein
MNRLQRAVELRDIAIAIVRAHGKWLVTRGGPKLLIYYDKASKLSISYRSPVQELPGDPPPAVPHPKPFSLRSLPYGIEVFQGPRMFNVDWADDGRMNVFTYNPGPWEGDLFKLVA